MRAARRDKTVSKHNEKKTRSSTVNIEEGSLRSSIPSPLSQQRGRLREERGDSRKSVSDEYATLYIRAHVLKHRFSFANHTVFKHLRSVLFHCFFQREKIFVAQSRKVSCESGAKSL